MTFFLCFTTFAFCANEIAGMMTNRAEKIRNSLPLKSSKMKTPTTFSRRHSLPDIVSQENNTDFINRQDGEGYGVSGVQSITKASGKKRKLDFMRKKLKPRRHSLSAKASVPSTPVESERSSKEVGQFGQTNNTSDSEADSDIDFLNVDGYVSESSSRDNSEGSSVDSVGGGGSSLDSFFNMFRDTSSGEEISNSNQPAYDSGSHNSNNTVAKTVKFSLAVDHVHAPNGKGETQTYTKRLNSVSLEDKVEGSGGKTRHNWRKYVKYLQKKFKDNEQDQQRYDEYKKSDSNSDLAGIIKPEKFESHNPSANLFQSFLSQDITGVKQAMSEDADFWKMLRLAYTRNQKNALLAPVEVLCWLLPIATSQVGPMPDGAGDEGGLAKNQWKSRHKKTVRLITRIPFCKGEVNSMYEGKTALDWATEQENNDLCEQLIGRGALSGDEVKAQDDDGKGFLSRVASYGSSAYASWMGDGQDDTN